MPFSRPTLQTIIDRIESDMESRLTGNVSLLRRALLRVLARVFAGAMHLVYGFVTYISEQLFVTTAEISYLDRHGFMWGITRKAASFAVGDLTFAGVNGTLVPQGTQVQTEDGVEFETTASGTVAGGVVVVAATAVEPGEAGNIVGGTTVELIEPITGITGVTAPTTFGGGEDEESDDDYRQRILDRIQSPPAGGTAEDYELWAKEVSGVDAAWTFPTTPGPGQVTVAYRGSALVATVETYIATLMPVTTDLTVTKTTDKNIVINVRIDPNTSDFQTAITDNLEQFFETQAAPGEDILIQQINNAISSTGITDFVIDSITGTSRDVLGNLLFAGFEYGVLQTVNITAL